MPIGEYDKRLVILTRERGKIHAFARGARRQGNVMMACSQPFTFGQFTLYEGKSAYNLVSAQVENYFLELRQNLELVYYGFYFLELADYFGRENLDGTGLLKLLYQSFRALISGKEGLPPALIRYIYEWKILALEGMMPQLAGCVVCGTEAGEEPEGAMTFSCRAGGLICRECGGRYKDCVEISPTVLYALQYIAAVPVEKLYTFTLTEEAREELGRMAKRYYAMYVDGNFHSLALL